MLPLFYFWLFDTDAYNIRCICLHLSLWRNCFGFSCPRAPTIVNVWSGRHSRTYLKHCIMFVCRGGFQDPLQDPSGSILGSISKGFGRPLLTLVFILEVLDLFAPVHPIGSLLRPRLPFYTSPCGNNCNDCVQCARWTPDASIVRPAAAIASNCLKAMAFFLQTRALLPAIHNSTILSVCLHPL